MTTNTISKKISFEKTLPYISLFILLFAVCFIFSVIKDLNPDLIPYKINKLLYILLLPVTVVIELSRLRDYVWDLWKKIPMAIHLVVSFFFSIIMLKLVPIVVWKVWDEDNAR